MTPLDTNTLTHGSFGTFQMQASREAMVSTQSKNETCASVRVGKRKRKG